MKTEKAIAAALEPIIDVVAKLEARLKALEVPQHIEVPIDDVVAALKADSEFCDSVRGENAVAEPVDPAAVAKELFDVIPAPQPGRNGVDGVGVNVKEWLPGVYREGDIVQHDIGRIARAKRDTAEQPGTGDDWERVGKAGFRWRGVKDSLTVYDDGDFYIDDGTTFLMVDGVAKMFCRKGRDGKNGIGRDGKDSSALVGEVKIWPGIEPPEGYLLADGSLIPDDDKYKALRDVVGDHVPDFSSEFLVCETPAGPSVATFIVRACV